MNEEEKKAIEILKSWKNYNVKHKNKLLQANEIINVQETLLNLIEKLQKENEELKLKEKRRIIGKYGEVEIHDAINRVLSNDYIPKQKIKSKIEELEKKMKNANNEKVLTQLYKQRRILQELLENKDVI